MRRVAIGIATAALIATATACTADSDDGPTDAPTKHVAVDPDEVERHEATSGTPISFGIDVPEGAVQVGPLIRQRRADVQEVIDDVDGREDAFANDGDPADPADPETRDPDEPALPDFTTAMLRVDGDPNEVVPAMLGELSDSLEGSEIDAEHWRDYCVVDDAQIMGCRLADRGTTDDDVHVAVELTVYPGDPKAKLAAAGSLLRPVLVLTLEQLGPRAESGQRDRADAQARDAQNALDARKAEEAAIAKERDKRKADNKSAAKPDKAGVRDASSDGDQPETDDPTSDGDEPDSDGSGDPEADKPDEPKWPTMKRERPAEAGDWILTPKWKIRPNTEVILSSATPKVAMLAVKDGADTEAIARRYVRAFADVATTPKIDEVEDRNERSITYTPRNDGSGPAIAVTAVATGRGNYIELLYSDDADSPPGPNLRQKAQQGEKDDNDKSDDTEKDDKSEGS
ncbi:hypothetical protein MU582_04380 [Nocardioidaceae bacterium SCSIO 66511]|nr:hypothetical protein MU582_04380 [Nocardioidaceae bacterium SCSIO 66511]